MPGLIILLFLGFFGVMMLACGIGFKLMESHQRQRVKQMLKTVSSSAMTVEIKAAPALELAPEAGVNPPWPEIRSLAESGRGDPRRRARMARRGGAVRHGRNGPRGRFPGQPLQSSGVSVAEHARSPGPGHVSGLVYLPEAGKRMADFERQFPEALDFLARSVRAGHALSISLEMLANDAEAPLGPEFRRLSNELNLGTPFDVGLRNLSERVPLIDVRFFVSAVLMQRETGET